MLYERRGCHVYSLKATWFDLIVRVSGVGAYAPIVREIHNFLGYLILWCDCLSFIVRSIIQAVWYAMTFFWLYGWLGRAAEREWTERNATDWRTPCRKFLATPLVCLSVLCQYSSKAVHFWAMVTIGRQWETPCWKSNPVVSAAVVKTSGSISCRRHRCDTR